MDRTKVEQIARSLASDRGWGTPRFIDAGNSAAVFEVTLPERGSAALKVYDPSFFDGANALVETKRVELQQKLKGHGNAYLIDMIECGELSEAGTWYILMEFCPWPSLEKRLPHVPNSQVLSLIRQLSEAVLFLDGKGLVHRDIKPANIAVSEDFSQLKLLDLGVMRRISAGEGNGTDGGIKRRFIATAQYSPPEYLVREEPEGEDGFRALNIYQVGAVLHDLLMKRAIFADEVAADNRYILFRAVSTNIPFVENADVPARLVSICRAAIQKDPEVRVRAVSLADFCATIDTADTLRTRLLQGTAGVAVLPMPSLLIWSPRIAQRLRSAARSEAATLGPFRLRQVGSTNKPAWSLDFTRLGRSVDVSIIQEFDNRSIRVVLSAGSPAKVEVTAFEIYGASGESNDPTLAPRLAEQLLYLVDVAGQPTDEVVGAE